MRKRFQLRKGALLAVVLSFAGFATAQADGDRYTVLLKKHSIPTDFSATVEGMGGQVVDQLAQVGIVVAVSDDESFADLLASDSRVQSVGLAGAYSLPETVDVELPDSGPQPIDFLWSGGDLWGIDRVNAPAAWASTRWFYDQTETGKVMVAARHAMQEQDAPQPMWFYLAPGDS